MRWLGQERRSNRAAAAMFAVIALGSGVAVFLVMAFLLNGLLFLVWRHSVIGSALLAFAVTAAFFAHSMKSQQQQLDLVLDPLGLWVIKDLFGFGPRLMLDGLRQVRRCASLGELDVTACARALSCLAEQNRSIDWAELVRHCGQVSPEVLREQLLLINGVLLLGADASRVVLMEPFRLRLRAMLERERRAGRIPSPEGPKLKSAPRITAALDLETLSPYELLGLSPAASLMEIKAAYRKRVKECHPDLFSGMDDQAKALAERWTRALNAAYATLNPRHHAATPRLTRQR